MNSHSSFETKWPLRSFDEVFHIRIGGTPSRAREDFWSRTILEGYPWVSITDMRQQRITVTKERISDAGVKHSNVKLLPEGTIMMSFKLTLGRISIAEVPLYTNEAIAGLVPKDDSIDPAFVVHALKYVDLSAEMDQAVKGQTLNKDKLGRLLLPTPPPSSQKRIAAILDAADEAVHASSELIAQLETFKRGAMQELLSRGLPGQHERFHQTEVGEIPEGWEARPLKSLGKWGGGGTPSKANSEYWTGADIPWVSPKDMKSSRIIDAEDHVNLRAIRESSTNLYPENTILLVSRSGILRNNLPVAIAMRAVTINQDLKALIVGDDIAAEFAFHMLEFHAPTILEQCRKVGTTVESLQTSDLLEYCIALPSLPEQNEIVSIISTFDRRIQVERARGKQLEQVKRGLAQGLLSGELPVDVPEEVTAP